MISSIVLQLINKFYPTSEHSRLLPVGLPSNSRHLQINSQSNPVQLISRQQKRMQKVY